MGRNVTRDEYIFELQLCTAALHGVAYELDVRAEPVLRIQPSEQRDHMSVVSLLLGVDLVTHAVMGVHGVPRLRVSASSTLSGDPAEALVQLRRAEHALEQALFVFYEVRHFRVFFEDVPPCDACDGAFSSAFAGAICRHCHGTGKRPEKTP